MLELTHNKLNRMRLEIRRKAISQSITQSRRLIQDCDQENFNFQQFFTAIQTYPLRFTPELLNMLNRGSSHTNSLNSTHIDQLVTLCAKTLLNQISIPRQLYQFCSQLFFQSKVKNNYDKGIVGQLSQCIFQSLSKDTPDDIKYECLRVVTNIASNRHLTKFVAPKISQLYHVYKQLESRHKHLDLQRIIVALLYNCAKHNRSHSCDLNIADIFDMLTVEDYPQADPNKNSIMPKLLEPGRCLIERTPQIVCSGNPFWVFLCYSIDYITSQEQRKQWALLLLAVVKGLRDNDLLQMFFEQDVSPIISNVLKMITNESSVMSTCIDIISQLCRCPYMVEMQEFQLQLQSALPGIMQILLSGKYRLSILRLLKRYIEAKTAYCKIDILFNVILDSVQASFMMFADQLGNKQLMYLLQCLDLSLNYLKYQGGQEETVRRIAKSKTGLILQSLQDHPCDQIYKFAYSVIEKYFRLP